MIIVTGSVLAKPGEFERALALSRAHVARSRKEPGCLSHAVYRDADDDHRLFFFEEWADRDALAAHFAVPESRQFTRDLAELAAEPATLRVYSGERIRV